MVNQKVRTAFEMLTGNFKASTMSKPRVHECNKRFQGDREDVKGDDLLGCPRTPTTNDKSI